MLDPVYAGPISNKSQGISPYIPSGFDVLWVESVHELVCNVLASGCIRASLPDPKVLVPEQLCLLLSKPCLLLALFSGVLVSATGV